MSPSRSLSVMSDINLATYFRGIPGNYQCPECHKNHDSSIELREHLWTHREADAKESISNKNRRHKCPHLKCAGKIFAQTTPIKVHFRIHTRETKTFVCPHLVFWTPGDRTLCGYATTRQSRLGDHILADHMDQEDLQTAKHPWVVAEDVSLSAAKLHFGKPPRVKAHQGKDGAKGLDADDGQLPPVNPPAPVPAPVKAQGPVAAEYGANIQAQVAVPTPPRVRRHHARPPVPAAYPRRPIHLDPPNQFISRTATTPRRRLHPMLVIPPPPQYVYVPYVRRVSTGVRYDPYRRGMVEDFGYEHILMRMARD
ncbi:hypothetical protein QCA50_018277 [Cerrena zonata]|uniref:C2H2-type domain-containing protein n=1 Tax=Cerrena zonata TaxID=2478898 RepID=A0AAW0FI32_9APHY